MVYRKDLYKHIKSLKKPHKDKNFSLSLTDDSAKLEAVKNAVTDIKSNLNEVSLRIEKFEQSYR